MKINNKLIAVLVLAAIITIAAKPVAKITVPVHYSNLKVLPKNVSSKVLQGLMVDDFQDGLGVTCNFCHAANKDGHGLDYASDAKPEKGITRAMMRMTIGINKKYMKLKHPQMGSTALIISCNTCHKGQPFPDGAEPQ